jgi:parallel beta-helix repeat protein
LWLYGAVFRFDAGRKADGQAFLGEDVADVELLGGEVVGRNDAWPEGVNIRGVHIKGRSRNVRIRDLLVRDLSSNGVGVFGDPKHPIRDVWVTDCVIVNGCNRYGDYLSARPGPEKGSVREDQGLIAFYHVQDFVVRGCRLEKSRSDGTHFYRCRQGEFVANKVYAAQMGGYFVESCADVLASDNVIRDNGSRGATIERGSSNCTLRGNVVADSGREGLWAPDCTGLVVTGNVFEHNGRKPNGKKPHQLWNANVTVNKDPSDPTKSPTRDYLIAHNILYTTAEQVAAVRVDADRETTGVVVKDNLLRGKNRRIRVEGPGRDNVIVKGNE